MVGHLTSVNVGHLETLYQGSRPVRTGFHKVPRAGPVRLGAEGVEGDEIADLRVHGGPRKAVYAYPEEHYEYWNPRLAPLGALPWGSFGENLTVRGLAESTLRAGDRLEIGEAVLVVTQPRQPCFKLGLHHRRPELVREFVISGRSGFYLSVERPGSVAAGDPILERGGGSGPTIAELFRG